MEVAEVVDTQTINVGIIIFTLFGKPGVEFLAARANGLG